MTTTVLKSETLVLATSFHPVGWTSRSSRGSIEESLIQKLSGAMKIMMLHSSAYAYGWPDE